MWKEFIFLNNYFLLSVSETKDLISASILRCCNFFNILETDVCQVSYRISTVFWSDTGLKRQSRKRWAVVCFHLQCWLSSMYSNN